MSSPDEIESTWRRQYEQGSFNPTPDDQFLALSKLSRQEMKCYSIH